MEELIEELILNSEESSIIFVGDAIQVGTVALNLLEDGVSFVETGYIEAQELMANNDILAIAKNVYNDGKIDYFLEKIFNKDGKTLQDDSNIVFIDSDLVDCIDLDKFTGTKIIVEPDDLKECDCEYCQCCEEEIEDVLFYELMSSIDELELDDDLVNNIYGLIREKISDAYYLGRSDAIDEMQDKLYEL